MDEIVQSIRNEGIAEGKAEVALMMVNSGRISLAEASEILGIPISEVERLRREMHQT